MVLFIFLFDTFYLIIYIQGFKFSLIRIMIYVNENGRLDLAKPPCVTSVFIYYEEAVKK